MNLIKEWNLPIVTVSEMNRQEHWTKRYKRFKAAKKQLEFAFLMDNPKVTLPVLIKITRFSPQVMDWRENLPSAMKGVVDTLCDLLLPGLPPGRADADPRIQFEFLQEKGKKGSLRIQFYETN